MRRFRFVGDASEYSSHNIYKGIVLDGNYIEEGWDGDVLSLNYEYPEDWQEVFEETPLHQTDLGYYSGLVMQGYLANIFESSNAQRFEEKQLCRQSISVAKELIKQLKEGNNMDRFKELMDSLGAKECEMLDSDFTTGNRNYELKEDEFVISFFEGIVGLPGVFVILVDKKHNGDCIKTKYMIHKEMIDDKSIKEIVRSRIERSKEKLNDFINNQCQNQ